MSARLRLAAAFFLAAAAAAAAAAPAAAAGAAAPTCSDITLNAREPVFTTAAYFATWNIDSSTDREFFTTDFTAPAMLAAAAGLGAAGGTHVRFGGTGNNALVYDAPGEPACVPAPSGGTHGRTCLNASTWAGVAAFAARARSPVIFGVNMFPSGNESAPLNLTNAVAFLTAALKRGDAIFGVEMGNELGPGDKVTPAQQAAALLALDDALAASVGAQRPALVGPDLLGFHVPAPGGAPEWVPSAEILTWIGEFVVAMKGRLFAVTHHEYIEINATNVLDPAFLDTTAAIAVQVVAAVRAVDARAEVWAGEIGPHNGQGGPGDGRPGNCGGNLVCGRYGSALWYADAMAAKARAGYAAFCRQDVIGADYGLLNFTDYAPTPDYWLLLIWQRVVGARVLAVTAPPADARVRAYAFCGARAGTITLVLINLAPTAACVAPPALANPAAPLVLHVLAPADGTVTARGALLNGAPLAFGPGGALPDLAGASVAATLPISVPPLGVVFATFESMADACLGA